jgi:hypothetical protein
MIRRRPSRDERFAAQVLAGALSRTAPEPAADLGPADSAPAQVGGWQPPLQPQRVAPLQAVVTPIAPPPAADEHVEVAAADLIDPAGWPLPSLFADDEPAPSRRRRG